MPARRLRPRPPPPRPRPARSPPRHLLLLLKPQPSPPRPLSRSPARGRRISPAVSQSVGRRTETCARRGQKIKGWGRRRIRVGTWRRQGEPDLFASGRRADTGSGHAHFPPSSRPPSPQPRPFLHSPAHSPAQSRPLDLCPPAQRCEIGELEQSRPPSQGQQHQSPCLPFPAVPIQSWISRDRRHGDVVPQSRWSQDFSKDPLSFGRYVLF